ncbi:hypothetical protein PGTUg99_004342 [Puccinia graminis f. sp. tritici]|uniref:Uncharacterized protein n=1 Tax=Puccinia graminis f. sp. tritici TaxID=56615 RepID=A0A5B0RBP7_PUCGR|nr:hypothetical protein PGTUg99_004342 [Puccinia graminis f. sp. tritici]
MTSKLWPLLLPNFFHLRIESTIDSACRRSSTPKRLGFGKSSTKPIIHPLCYRSFLDRPRGEFANSFSVL